MDTLQGELVGFRQWDFEYPEDNSTPDLLPVMYSGFQGAEWKPGGVLKAKCIQDGKSLFINDEKKDACERSPNIDCDCGFYLKRTPNFAYEADVAGIVRAWGKMIVHYDQSFRCEFVQVVAITTTHGIWQNKKERDTYKRIADKYEIDLIEPAKYKDDLSFLLFEEAKKHGNLLPLEYVKAAQDAYDPTDELSGLATSGLTTASFNQVLKSVYSPTWKGVSSKPQISRYSNHMNTMQRLNNDVAKTQLSMMQAQIYKKAKRPSRNPFHSQIIKKARKSL